MAPSGVQRGHPDQQEDAMRVNTPRRRGTVRTHEGAPAVSGLSPQALLRRSVLSCLLWEDQFYEGGQTLAERIVAHAQRGKPDVLAARAVEGREGVKLPPPPPR